eukprot:TRINITY_DN14496_c0_g2_i3.p1 TRINITY_DN14496_c0_g2~~TRINITY_DN14496_c0_g2_i3.p1  ORF type:complete len:251 (-),score=16.59 TRINITY_DN14496_c0_g2_i3:367-1119(-)
MLIRSASSPSFLGGHGLAVSSVHPLDAEIGYSANSKARGCRSVHFPFHSPSHSLSPSEIGCRRSVNRRMSVSFALNQELLPETLDEDFQPFKELAIPFTETSNGGGGGREEGGRKGGSGSGSDHQTDADAYYQMLLKSDPTNALVLRNYAKFLHEVKRDHAKAEEYYERAILSSPGDGDVLSLYGNLIWDVHGDASRAEAYFGQAVEAAPDDCYVLGSYADFLWKADGDEEEEQEPVQREQLIPTSVEVY